MIYQNLQYFFKNLKHELKINVGLKIKLFILLYRICSFGFYRGGVTKILTLPIYFIYRIYAEFLIGIELPISVLAGEGLRIYHGVGLVVHPNAKIGKRCILRQGVTIGNKVSRSGISTRSPTICDDVEFGAGAVVIGEVTIGSRVTIGANTVVTKNIQDDSVVVGQSFRVL